MSITQLYFTACALIVTPVAVDGSIFAASLTAGALLMLYALVRVIAANI